MIQAKSADVCGLPKSPVISVARNQKLNENESKEPQETTYVSAGDMLTAPWPCQNTRWIDSYFPLKTIYSQMVVTVICPHLSNSNDNDGFEYNCHIVSL